MPPEESLLFAQASHFSLTYGIGVYTPYRAGKSAGEENLNEIVKPLKEVPPV
jgi:hypothetical protein